MLGLLVPGACSSDDDPPAARVVGYKGADPAATDGSKDDVAIARVELQAVISQLKKQYRRYDLAFRVGYHINPYVDGSLSIAEATRQLVQDEQVPTRSAPIPGTPSSCCARPTG